jgi:hypothetical protein
MKPKKPLTDRSIAHLPFAQAGKRKIVWDAIVPGLGIRVTDRGVKSFVLVVRYPGSPNPSSRSLGTYGAITLEAARVKAREWLALIGNGTDPAQHLAQRREQTFQAIADQYLLRKAKDLRSKDKIASVCKGQSRAIRGVLAMRNLQCSYVGLENSPSTHHTYGVGPCSGP